MLSAAAAHRLAAGARAARRAGRPRARTVGASTTARSARPLAPAGAAPLLRRQIPALSYSTERIVALRSGKTENLPKTVYDPQKETENCGVGLVASLKSVPSRKVVDDADEMLIRMSHRGGVGCCPASGDGAGEWWLLCGFWFGACDVHIDLMGQCVMGT